MDNVNHTDLLFWILVVGAGAAGYYRLPRDRRVKAREIEGKDVLIPVYLRTGSTLSPDGWIEKLIFGRTDVMKNNPRGNYLFLQAVFVFISVILHATFFITVLGLAHFELTNRSIDDFLAIARKVTLGVSSSEALSKAIPLVLSGIFILYNKNHADFHTKWKYCCDLFNRAAGEKDEDIQADLYRYAAVDMVALDMWAQRTLAGLFADELVTAARWLYEDLEYAAFIDDLNAGKVYDHEARTILQEERPEPRVGVRGNPIWLEKRTTGHL